MKKYYNQYCAILRKVIRNAKHNYYNNLLMTAENKSKKTWRIINNASGNIKNKSYTSMFRSGKTFFQLDFAAEASKDYFLKVVEKLYIGKVDINSALLSLNNLSF
jgi:hypothetical protein